MTDVLDPRPGTPEAEVAALEREVMEKQAKLNELRRNLPREAVEDYVLQNSQGEVRLSELFGDHRDLIVIHNMGTKCRYCTLWADGFNGQASHFLNRAGFVVVSPDPTDVQQRFAESRNWTFPMASAAESSFTADMGFVREMGGKMGTWPGFSTFHRDDSGKMARVAHASFGPGDPYCGIWHLFGVLADGVNDWEPQYKY